MAEVRQVPFFDYPHVFLSEEKHLMPLIREVLSRGAYVLQKDLSEFEKNLADYVGCKYAIGVANATDALMLLLRAAGIGPGDEVIFSSHTMTATAAAIHFVGATPVPADCGLDHLICPKSAARAITPKTKAIMPTQLNGRTCAMEPLLELAQAHNLLIVEDSAQGLGSLYKGKAAGTFGIGGCISFYPAKNLGCFGDGGAVITDHEQIYNQLRLLRDHGRDEKGKTVCWGINSRLDNLQAAVLNYRLKSYDKIVSRRREIASIYQDQLGRCEQLVLPPAPDSDADHFDIFQNYEIEAERRDELKSFLADNGIGTLIQWSGQAVHQIEALGFDVELPNTDELFRRCLMLPLNMSLSNEDVIYVSDKIKQFYRV